MRSRAPLALMEQTVMVLVFVLAAALCLRLFESAELTSRTNARRDQALLHAQNAAQVLKEYRGDYDAAARHFGGRWDGQVWTLCPEDGEFWLRVSPAQEQTALLGSADVEGYTDRGELLVRLEVSWQEVDGDG